MIVGPYPNWRRIFRQIGATWSLIILLAAVTSFLNYLDHPFKPIAIPDVTISVLGAALGILLGFRTNSAYARWWEARQLWGALVNSSRSLARQAFTFFRGAREMEGEAAAFVQILVYHQISFVHALRCMLRRQEPWANIQPFLAEAVITELRQQKNVPAAILQRMGEMSGKALDVGWISEWRLQRLDATYTDLANIQGACERIKNTPLPRQYDFYPELFVKAYCILLPLVLVDELKFWTPVATALISFVFLVLNRIGKNLEDPFENSVYDTPMTSLSRTIEVNLRQALGETDLPPFLQPEKGVLL